MWSQFDGLSMMVGFALMGVSGCGKTSVGEAIAADLGLDFVDGDDLHPTSSIRKMAAGIALSDDDRAPWLADVGRTIARHDGPIVIGCSALKRVYRDWIRQQVPAPVHFIHLDAAKDVLAQRVVSRPGHFMPPSLLDSQFATLEALAEDESGCVVDINRPFTAVVSDAKHYVLSVLK